MVGTTFGELHEAVPTGATVLDCSTDRIEILDVNEQFCELTGYPRAELIGREWSVITGSETDPDHLETVQSALENHEAATVELQCYRNDGTTFWNRMQLSPDVDNSQSPRYLCLHEDVTSRREQIRELKRQNERLEEYATTVTHDLRNPLNIALTRVELAKRMEDPEQLSDAMAALERMDSLIESTLAASRGSTGNTERNVDLSTVAQNAWKTVDSDGATLNIEVDAEVMANESRLQQLFENLFTNAVTHGTDGVTVTVGQLDPITTSLRDTGELSGFYVADDGGGFPDHMLDQRETASIGELSEDGHGLRIVESIVDDHDWQLYLSESSEGGARFEINGVTTA